MSEINDEKIKEILLSYKDKKIFNLKLIAKKENISYSALLKCNKNLQIITKEIRKDNKYSYQKQYNKDYYKDMRECFRIFKDKYFELKENGRNK